MTVQETLAFAHEKIALNEQVNGSYYSNAAVAGEAAMAGKLIDVVTQLQGHQVIIEDKTAQLAEANEKLAAAEEKIAHLEAQLTAVTSAAQQ